MFARGEHKNQYLMKRIRTLFNFINVMIAMSILSGCAVHYYDRKTGAEHVFGFGHMVMKVSVPEGSHQAVVKGTDVIGLGIGQTKEGGYLSLGWDSRRWIEVIDKNTTVDLAWPNGNFLNTRIGSSWPIGEAQKNNQKGSDYE